jgi:hypothetical protein
MSKSKMFQESQGGIPKTTNTSSKKQHFKKEGRTIIITNDNVTSVTMT